VKYNTAYAPDFGVFEIGRVVDGVNAETGLVNEQKKLCITLFSKTKSTEQLYLELRDMLAVLADDIRHETVTFRKMEATHSYQHPRNLNAVCCAGVELGELGVVYPTISKKIDKKAAIVYAEVDVEKFSAIASRAIAYEEPSRYPEMEVDLTFLTDVYAPIGEAIAKAACPLIRKVSVVGRYEDEAGKTITVRLVFADRTRTLTREEVTAVVDAIVADLAADGISMKL
jgi:phenylalanyl-tRNA synthetase beta chain